MLVVLHTEKIDSRSIFRKKELINPLEIELIVQKKIIKTRTNSVNFQYTRHETLVKIV